MYYATSAMIFPLPWVQCWGARNDVALLVTHNKGVPENGENWSSIDWENYATP